MKTIIFGAGYLGTRLANRLQDAVLVPRSVDATDERQVRKVIQEYAYDADSSTPIDVDNGILINVVGKTGSPNIDWCEDHQQETIRSNITAALTIAKVAQDLGCYLIHLSSGCIFYGPSPHRGAFKLRDLDRLTTEYEDLGWNEDDFANPKSFYSKTKYASDVILSALPHVAVVRIRMPIDSIPHPRNLLTKLLQFKQVIDTPNSITVMDDFIHVIQQLIKQRATGVFHVVNPGIVRHPDILLRMYQGEKVDPKRVFEVISETELLSKGLVRAPRSNCVLANTRLPVLGIQMRPVTEALEDVMSRYGK